jgi:ribosomal protein RSM22 (predicted rRNA methylase)
VVATLYDRDAAALASARAAIAAVAAGLGVRCEVATAIGDVAALPAGRFELVLAGTVVNELPDGAALVRRMLAALAPGGVAVVIEPALRDAARALHAIRDALIADGTAAVLAPCTRRAAPCPALADPRDWCHDHRPAELPPRARQLAAVTGLRDGDAKFAFLALARPADAPPPLPAWRVVDDPHAPKGKLELTACGEPGWVPVRLLRRHRGAANRALERAHRGDLLAIASPVVDGRIELAADDAVLPRA